MRAAAGLAGAAAAAACDASVPERVEPSLRYPVVWDAAALGLASQTDVPARLAQVDAAGAGWVEYTGYCRPAVGADVLCVDASGLVAASCDEQARMEAAGFGASANLHIIQMRASGALCAAVAAVGAARPARHSAVRDFRLTPAAIDTLSPLLGLRYSDDWDARARHNAAWGVPWSRSDPGHTATVHDQDGFGEILDVQSEFEIVWVRILGRGDFDGDGWDDLLADAPGEPLRVVRQVY
jgi:hypothetical protein